MGELILDEERGDEILPSSPSAIDIDALRARFLPQSDEWGIEDFQTAGIGIIETVRECATVLGELTELGWRVIRPHITWNGERIESVTRWEQYCAALWGCSRATVSKAWTSATSELECPPDMAQTTFYEILAGTDSTEEADRVVDLALRHGWRSYHIRLMKRLHDAGLLPRDEWVLPQVTRQEYTLYVTVGNERTPFAWLKEDNRLGRIGAFLLTDGAGIRTEQKQIEGRVNDGKKTGD